MKSIFQTYLNSYIKANLIAGSILAILLSGCAGGVTTTHKQDEQALPVTVKSSKPPNWVLGRGHPKYPLSQYIVGVGISEKNSVSANESSRAELAKSLKVKIRSKMEDYADNDRTLIQSLIETEVNTILEGVEIKDGWYDNAKKVYYSFTALGRSLAASGIKNRITETESLLEENLNDGNRAEEQGDVVGSLSHYLSGYHKAFSLPSLKSALRVITKKTSPSEPSGVSKNTFLKKVNGITQNLRLKVVSGNNQVVKTYSGISEPLVAEVYLEKDAQKIPLSNIPLVFRFEKGAGDLELEKTSDRNGQVQTTIHKIESFEETNRVITAKLNYETFISRFEPQSKTLLSSLKHLKVFFNYTIDIPKWASYKSLAWKSGITNLVNQIIQNIPPEGSPLIGITGFKDLRHEKVTPFNEILKEDFETVLVQAPDLIVKEIIKSKDSNHEETAKGQNLDFYINGSYRLEEKGLEIRAKLIATRSGHILSSGNILIKKGEINPEDLALLINQGKPSPAEAYADNLENMIASKPETPTFNIRVWTNKNEYQIGEKIVFHVTSDKDAYLTLFDISSSGDTTVIFPNAYHKDNFLQGGRTYDIPAEDYGFQFDVQGPAGLERIKAIATVNRDMPIDLDLSNGFHQITPGTTQGTRDIKVLANEFSGSKRTGWAEASSEIYIFEQGQIYYRGSRKIPIVDQPEKPKDILGTLGNESER
ncbi:MAG: DUF4384 domain-containing protein [Nitrospinaceae bacterium]|jgi:TolB-like protein